MDNQLQFAFLHGFFYIKMTSTIFFFFLLCFFLLKKKSSVPSSGGGDRASQCSSHFQGSVPLTVIQQGEMVLSISILSL